MDARLKHRETLINALIAAMLDGHKNEELLAQVLLKGHQGYENYLDMQLVYEAEDNSLRTPEVQGAIAYLRKLYEE